MKKMLAGTRERLILTSCTIAVLLVFLAGGVFLTFHFGGNENSRNDNGTNSPDNHVTPMQTQKPLPPPAPPSINQPPQNVPPKESEEQPEPAPPAAPASPPLPVTPEQPQNPPTPAPVQPPGPEEEKQQANKDQPAPPAPAGEPLKELASAVELPSLGGDDAQAGGVTLGKVHLDAQTKLQVELIGGDKSNKGFGKYALQEDPNSVGGQAWNIMRIDMRGKATPLARLKLKGENLNFDWMETVPPSQANPLRNCGISITAGEASRFVQFRLPRSADPIILDLDKGTAPVHFRVNNLPEFEKLKLIIRELKPPFPPNEIKPEVAMTSARKMVEIGFNGSNYSIFSIYVIYDTIKKDAISLDASAFLRNKPFKLPASEALLRELKADLARKERLLSNAKNNNTIKANLTQLVDAAKADLQQCTEAIELAKKLNNQPIHYRIVVEYEKFQVELFDSLLPPPKEAVGE